MRKRAAAFFLALALLFCAVAQAETVIEPAYPVPDYVELLLETARNEIGYTEKSGGYTKYGDWAGAPTTEWCAEFLCWCVDQVDQNYGTSLLTRVYPKYGATNVGLRWFVKQGRYISRKGTIDGWGSQWMKENGEPIEKNGYIPQPGDWMFFSVLATGDTTHVAMVEYCTTEKDGTTRVHVIEGNNPSAVARNSYAIDDWRILGYGTVYDLTDVTMKSGCEGEKVKALQSKLQLLGFLEDKYVTGTYSTKTIEAVRALQKQFGIEETGVAGAETQKALENLLSVSDIFAESFVVVTP